MHQKQKYINRKCAFRMSFFVKHMIYKQYKQIFNLPLRCTNISHDIYKVSKKRICYTKFLGGEVGTKAYGLDGMFPPDSIWFCSDAGRELWCM